MTQIQAVEQWWRTLTAREQRDLLRLGAEDPLPVPSANALARRGVTVPPSPWDEDVPAQPEALATFLVGIRYMN